MIATPCWRAIATSSTRRACGTVNVVDGNTGYGVSWDAHNFSPAGKMNVDGGATVVGYNSGNSLRPYISGSAYRDLMFSGFGFLFGAGDLDREALLPWPSGTVEPARSPGFLWVISDLSTLRRFEVMASPWLS